MTIQHNTLIEKLVANAKKAQETINNYSQEQVDELILAVAWEIIQPENNQELSEMAVKDTGLGNIEDKKRKNRRKTLGLLRDLKGVKTVGIIDQNVQKGIIEIARPVGVIGAVVPSTNPVATPLNKVINALKCRNAIILAPSPKGAKVCTRVVELIQIALTRTGAPKNIVQSLPEPISKEDTNELSRLVDLIVATGSQNNIQRALQSGTPTLGVGVGNVPSIIDESANLNDASHKIMTSKTFDNATSCSSENSIIVLKSVYEELINSLEEEGGSLLDIQEKKILQQGMWSDNGIINRDIIAKKSNEIATLVGLKGKHLSSKFLMVEEQNVGLDYPFSMEKLSPVLAVYKAKDFSHAVEIATLILKNQGKGHSCGIHSQNEDNIERLGMELPVCRVIVNQAHCFATGGNFDNALPFSLSMGCGTWGNNVTDENLNYKHYLNITKIVKTIEPDEPSEKDIFSDYWEKYSLKSSTVTKLVDQYASDTPEKNYLIDADLNLQVSYSQLQKDILALGAYFKANNIHSNDKVGFMLDNGYASTLLFVGAMYHGVVIVPLNVLAGSKQIKYTIDHSECKIIFASRFYTDKFKDILSASDASVVEYSQIDSLKIADEDSLDEAMTLTHPDTPAVLIYTSGTTGVPKGALLSHKNVIAGGRNTVIAHEISSSDISFCVLPLYHINAEMVSIASALVSNSCVVTVGKFSVKNFWQIIEKYECSWFSVVPTIINYLLNDNFNVKALELKNLRFGRSASAPLSPEVHKKFEKTFGVKIIETMGLTETAAQILSNPPTNGKHGSAGKPYGNEVRVIADNGSYLSHGNTGELVIKGDNVLLEYFKNEEATSGAFNEDGYFLTGDLGVEDEDGFFFITGRKKELIIKGGENISPREIDDTLYKHNAVLEACTFGIKDDNYGEEISACVFLKDDLVANEKELLDLCKADLGEYKTPRQIIFVDEPLPKGPSGKIQRLKIASQYSRA
ncbi:acylating sulfoacetaldehyde dehydrogenase [Candidatus Pseudothioglobus singularis]|uniref:Succinate-semialdehyde dehydrogenase n=1 Tax=Candidatus Pseudothioglobus singularis PS1 TaxID=1125411 RepID=A0A0M5KYJ2_9GAMM|nr:aldehyde dehydrogenase family protein [Candidatus Pseudothioglobus singularis]ALE01928.1 succinate-semialdehyde dehydrogenase [Candidatus Pseudothioglobus singularis PS1]